MSDEYKRGMAVFSGDDYVEQIRKAEQSVKNSLPSLGISHDDGVILMTGTNENKSELMRQDDLSNAFMIGDRVGMISSGRVADAQTLAEDMRDVAVEEIDKYGRVEDINILVREIAENVRNTTQEITYRPYGVSVIVGGLDGRNNSELYKIALDGAVTSWSAVAIGGGCDSIMEELENEYENLQDIEDCAKLGIELMTKYTEIDVESVSAVEITDENEFRRLQTDELRSLLNQGDKQ